jgi:hypothetical protein
VAEKTQKMYRVYTIVQRPKQDDYWLNIGAAFPHENGKGFNIILQAHPIGEKLVVLPYVRAPVDGDRRFRHMTSTPHSG